MTLRLIRPIINRGRYKQADGACYGTVGRKDAAVERTRKYYRGSRSAACQPAQATLGT